MQGLPLYQRHKWLMEQMVTKYDYNDCKCKIGFRVTNDDGNGIISARTHRRYSEKGRSTIPTNPSRCEGLIIPPHEKSFKKLATSYLLFTTKSYYYCNKAITLFIQCLTILLVLYCSLISLWVEISFVYKIYGNAVWNLSLSMIGMICWFLINGSVFFCETLFDNAG